MENNIKAIKDALEPAMQVYRDMAASRAKERLTLMQAQWLTGSLMNFFHEAIEQYELARNPETLEKLKSTVADLAAFVVIIKSSVDKM